MKLFVAVAMLAWSLFRFILAVEDAFSSHHHMLKHVDKITSDYLAQMERYSWE